MGKGALTERKIVKAKKDCCKDRTRCKSCPVVCKRLVLAGFAEPAGKRRFAIAPDTPKAVLKAARVRPKG